MYARIKQFKPIEACSKLTFACNIFNLRNNKRPLQIQRLGLHWHQRKNWRIKVKSFIYLRSEPFERLSARQYPLLEDFAVDRGELGVFKKTAALSAASLDLIVIFVPLFRRHSETKSTRPMQNCTEKSKWNDEMFSNERVLHEMNNALKLQSGSRRIVTYETAPFSGFLRRANTTWSVTTNS